MSQGVHTAPRRLRALAAALLLAAASVIVTASPAAAHDQLLSSTPAADETVEGLPAELVLTFSAVIASDAGASEVQVTDAAGTQLAGEPVADGTTLTVPLEGEASGAVAVVWKVVSSDGHPISGQFAFTVTPAVTPTETPSPTATPTPTESAAPTESASPTPTTLPGPPMEAVNMTPWIIGGLLLLVAVGAAVLYLLVSRARRRKALAESRESALGGHPSAPADPGSGTTSDR